MSESLAKYISRLESEGQSTFTADSGQIAMQRGRGAFLKAAKRLERQGRLVRLRKGFYVIVRTDQRHAGAPPTPWYIDPLMNHLGSRYYVGILKAAELHGASHQAVMQFQVVADRQMPDIKAGRTTIAFSYRKDLHIVEHAVDVRNTDAGTMRVSTVELTVLDLVRYIRTAGGIDNVATILREIATSIDTHKLGVLSQHFRRSTVQRLGYLLTDAGHREQASNLLEYGHDRSKLLWIELDPRETADPRFRRAAVSKDSRWKVTVRRHPEADI